MKTRYCIFCTLGLLLWCGRGLAADVNPDLSPEDVLKAKGLTRVGVLYLVERETTLPASLRAVRAAQRQLDDHASKRTALEKDLDANNERITDWNQQLVRTNERLAKTNTKETAKYNAIAAQIDLLRANLLEALRFGDQRSKDLLKLGDSPEDYVGRLTDLSEMMEAVAKQYASLATDDEVKSALTRLNVKASPKVRLGPSASFTEALPWVRRQRDKINSSVIKFKVEGGVPTVNVMLNGSLMQPMTFDSGAASVVLSWDVAQQLKLTAAPGDPIVNLHTADGKITEARVMVLKSVQLGPFKVENVTCDVFPKSMHGSNLLGGTFLKNFVVRMDLGAHEIRLSQMSGKSGGAELTTLQSPTTAPAAEKEIYVPATRTEKMPVPTGIRLSKGQTFIINANGIDRWSKGTGTHKGKQTDYRGYTDQKGWLALSWKIGGTTGIVQSGAMVTAPEAGELLLFCADDKPAKNEGEIRATISLKSIGLPSTRESPEAILTRQLNDFNEWSINQGKWQMANGRLRGEGETRIDFNPVLPADCVLRCRVNVVGGMRPRMYFGGTGLMFGNERYTKHFFPEGVKVTDGKDFPYENGEEHAIAFKFSGAGFEVEMDGKHAFTGTRTVASSIHLFLRGGDDWSRGTTEFWDFKIEPAPLQLANGEPGSTPPAIKTAPPDESNVRPSHSNIFTDPDSASSKTKAPTTAPAKEFALAHRKVMFSNASDAREGGEILRQLDLKYPDVLKEVQQVEMVGYHEGVEFKRRSGGPKAVGGSYSKTAAVGRNGDLLFWGIYEKWEPGKYLFVYRLQSLSEAEGTNVCFLDLCSNGNTIATHKPEAGEFKPGQWSVMPVLYEVHEAEKLEYRLWPYKQEIALDRVYVFRMK